MLNIRRFASNTFFAQIYGYAVFSKLTGRGNRPMKFQKITAAAKSFSPLLLKKGSGNEADINP